MRIGTGDRWILVSKAYLVCINFQWVIARSAATKQSQDEIAAPFRLATTALFDSQCKLLSFAKVMKPVHGTVVMGRGGFSLPNQGD
jgi:hypothetical protein